MGNRFKLYFDRPRLVVEEIDYEFQGGFMMVVVFEVCGRRNLSAELGHAKPERQARGEHLL